MKVRHLIYAATAGLMLASCNKGDSGTDEPAVSHFPDDGVIRVTTLVNEAVRTRASLTTQTLEDFYLNFITSGSSDYSYCEQITKNDQSHAWESANVMLWKNKTTAVSFAAAKYGDYEFEADDFTGEEDVDLTLPFDQSSQDDLNSADLLIMQSSEITNPGTYTGPLMTNDGKLVVALDHRLSKLNFTLTLKNEFERKGFYGLDVADFTVETGDPAEFTFNVAEGEVVSTNGNNANVISAFQSEVEDHTEQVLYEAIVLPGPKGNIKVAFTIDDKNYTWESAWASQNVELQPGYQYNIPLTVGSDVVTLEDANGENKITAVPWTTVENASDATPADISTY